MKISANFQKRLIFGLLVAVVLFATLYFSMTPGLQWLFAFLLMGVAGLALWEYSQLAIAKGYNPLVYSSIAGACGYILTVYLQATHALSPVLPQAVLLGLFMLFFLHYFVQDKEPLTNLSVSLFGFVYLALPLSLALSINYFFAPGSDQDGRWWLVYLLMVTKWTDIGAYIFGKQFGTHLCAPYISPKKTWEGAFGGLFTAIAVSVALKWAFDTLFATPPIALSWTESLLLGAAISIVGQFGDLAESLLKRDAAIKDSNQLPGLGGMLDMVDSLIFALPLLYLYLSFQRGL